MKKERILVLDLSQIFLEKTGNEKVP